MSEEEKAENQQETAEKKEEKPETKKEPKVNLVYGALLLHSAGKEVSEDGMKKIIDAVGASVDDAQIKALVAALDGVNIDEAISKAAMPVAAAAPATQAATEEKKEEPSEEEQEKKAEEAAEGLGALFG